MCLQAHTRLHCRATVSGVTIPAHACFVSRELLSRPLPVACACLPRLPFQVRSLLVVAKLVRLLLQMLAPQVRGGPGSSAARMTRAAACASLAARRPACTALTAAAASHCTHAAAAPPAAAAVCQARLEQRTLGALGRSNLSPGARAHACVKCMAYVQACRRVRQHLLVMHAAMCDVACAWLPARCGWTGSAPGGAAPGSAAAPWQPVLS